MIKRNYNRIIASKGVADDEALSLNFENGTHPFLCKPCIIEAGGYAIFDFKTELCGRLHIVFAWNEENGIARVRLGESVAETCAEKGVNNAGNYHSLRDCVYPVVALSDFSTSESGFRFARIDNVGDCPIKISSVYAEEVPNGLAVRGKFTCSDERLNKIYEVAERTLSLCVRENDVWDGIKRDRVAWIGDFYPELIGAHKLYGDILQFRKVLDLIYEFDDAWVNSIPSYSAWWIICLEKYYELSGNETYVKGMLRYVEKIVRDFDVIIKKDGEVSYADSNLGFFKDNEFFLDWQTCKSEDSKTGWRYLVIYAMSCAKKLLETFGADDALAKELIERLDRYEYADSEFKQVTALGVLCGRLGGEEAKVALKKNGIAGTSAFMSFAVIEAMKKLGEGEKALDFIRDYFGAMIDLGATTFWEDFDGEWLNEKPLPLDALPDPNKKNIHADFGRFCYKGLRHSLCHGWSCGFTDFLYTFVLGISPLEPGYKSIKIDPHLCDLNFVSGVIPTAYGDVKVDFRLENGMLTGKIVKPKNVVIECTDAFMAEIIEF